MRIDQILTSFARNDAIGTDTLFIQKLLRARGFQSDIFSFENPDRRNSLAYSEYQKYSNPDNIFIHHFSIGSELPYYLVDSHAFKVTRYHNITPSCYFDFPETQYTHWRCLQGRSQIPFVELISDYYWPVSNFNAQDFSQKQDDSAVLPILRDYASLAKSRGCERTAKLLKLDKRKNMLFVGRVIPNKAHHDLLLYLSLYRKYISEDLRLVIVGGVEPYYGKNILFDLARDLGLSISFNPESAEDYDVDVVMAGTVSEPALVSYYRCADLFLCLSDHEGFGVPLVEAMFFKLPIIAHEAAAIPETLGDGGLLINKDKPAEVLEGIDLLLNSEILRKQYIEKANQRAQCFSWQKLEKQFDYCLDSLIKHRQQISYAS